MKKLDLRFCAVVLAVMLALSATACNTEEEGSSSQEVQSVASQVESEPEEIEEPDIGEHEDFAKNECEGYYSNGLLIVDQNGHKRAMETFTGESDSIQFYANELNMMKDTLGTKINVYSMVVPTPCEYYFPSNYRGDIDSQQDIILSLDDMLVNVENVNVWDTLNNHNAEDIYFRTDNRWTPLGAYYAGKAFAKTAGVDYADLSAYTKVDAATDYVGNASFYVDYTGLADLQADAETFTYYKPSNKYNTYYYDENFEFLAEGEMFEEVPESLYETFFKGGYYCVKITTDVKNDRKLIIVRDSFGTALAPFLTSSFEEIYVVDLDYLEANLAEVIIDFEITDVLYLTNTVTATGTSAYQLETLRSQATKVELKDNAPKSTYTTSSTESGGDTDTESDSDTDTENISTDEYIYGVGLNNQIGVIEHSDDDTGGNTGEEYTVSDETGEYDDTNYGDTTAYDDTAYGDSIYDDGDEVVW